VKKIVDGFNLNGTVNGSNHNMATVGSMAVAAMANTQEVLDAFAEDVLTLRDDYWYSGYLGNLYLLALTGNMWTPEIVDTKIKNNLVKNKPDARTQIKIAQKTNRNFAVSGLPHNSTISFTSLSGKVIFSVSDVAETQMVDIYSVQSGCYILTVRDNHGVNIVSQIVPIY
ncbi:MAG: T9SS type A sorting domain-containing protein, partial [Fibrobacter sp.]|nr:T9SS type A sorting domain-containing protein [Fibrobacter sp.]